MIPRLIATLLCTLAATAMAGTPDIPDEINARLARAKVQIATAAGARGAAASASEDGAATVRGGVLAAGLVGKGCNIAIGNVVEDKNRLSTSARRETTVIITGDVIQVGNNCR